MEPVSSLILMSSLAVATATAKPRWEAPKIEAKSPQQTTLIEAVRAPTNTLVGPLPGAMPFVTLKDRLLAELQAYKPGEPGSDPGITSSMEDIRTAETFLKALPAGIPLPILMRDDEGKIGMYWDIDDVYLDINIDPGQTLSLFSKVRSEGVETFIDSIAIKDINRNWAYEHLAILTSKQALVA